MSLFTIENLGVKYEGRPAIEGVDLEIPAGRITALIGPSGCGKTSLLSSLNRMTDLVRGCRVDGRLRFDGIDVLDPGTDTVSLRRRVGMIFQKPMPFPISVRQNLELGLKEHGIGDRRDRPRRIEEALREVGLWEEIQDRLDQPANRLSGGQQQRLCIARALVLRPEVLLMDEPCSALDPISSGVVEDLIVRLREQVSVVIVTHNLAQAQRIADEVAFFWTRGGSGRLIEKGPCACIFEQPQHELTEAYVRGRRG